MRPKGIIYKKGRSALRGETVITLPKIERMAYHLLRSAGAGFIGFAIIGIFFAYGPVIKEEIGYGISGKSKGAEDYKIKVAEADKVLSVQSEAEYWGVDSYFSVVVPKIQASSRVIANVDTSVEDQYLDALRKGVAHARGTYFPGQGENIYLFSHSTDSPFVSQYNAVFYLLRKLEKGDEIIVFFADKKFEYVVEETIVASAEDTSYLQENTDSERLVLQTCDPPGTTWKRLLVIASPASQQDFN